MAKESGIDPTIKLLASLFVFLVVCLFAAEWLFRSDNEFFEAIAHNTDSMVGALLGVITGYKTGTMLANHSHPPPPAAGTSPQPPVVVPPEDPKQS